MDYDELRERMVEEQLRPRGINDRKVLEAFTTVPRHRFVPEPYVSESYKDYPLPIGFGQTISQPYMVALMTQLLGLKGHEKVLEIGTGSGYQAAILASLCSKVCTIERDEHLYERAAGLLPELGYDNVSFKLGDGTNGWEEEAPFEGIIVTAGAPEVPEALKEQLAEGGRLLIPVGPRLTQVLVLIERKGDEFNSTSVCGCVFVPLIGDHGW